MKKKLYYVYGTLSLLLAILGMALPVLPTVPLVLLALYCFAQASDRIRRRIMATKYYEKHLAEYVRTKAIPLKRKIAIQVSAGLMMALTFILLKSWVARAILVAGFLIHNYVFIFKIKTAEPEQILSETTQHTASSLDCKEN